MDCQGIFSVIPSPEYNLNRMPFFQVFEIWCSRETGSYYRSCLYVSLLTVSTAHLQFLIWKYVQCQEKSSSVCSIQPHLFTIIGFFFLSYKFDLLEHSEYGNSVRSHIHGLYSWDFIYRSWHSQDLLEFEKHEKKDQSLQQKKGSFDIFQVLDDLPF